MPATKRFHTEITESSRVFIRFRLYLSVSLFKSSTFCFCLRSFPHWVINGVARLVCVYGWKLKQKSENEMEKHDAFL